MKVKPMDMLLMMLVGCINRRRQDVVMRIRVSLVQGIRGHFGRSLVDNSTPQQAMEGMPDWQANRPPK